MESSNALIEAVLIPLYSLFTTTRNTLEYFSYSAQHRWSSRKWSVLLTQILDYISMFFFLLAGIYCSAPVWGRIVDSRGPRIVLIVSLVFLLGGYSGIKYIYDSGLPPGTSTLPTLGIYLLVLYSFLTGSGGLGGLTSSLNSTIKSFPDGVVSEWAPIVVC